MASFAGPGRHAGRSRRRTRRGRRCGPGPARRAGRRRRCPAAAAPVARNGGGSLPAEREDLEPEALPVIDEAPVQRFGLQPFRDGREPRRVCATTRPPCPSCRCAAAPAPRRGPPPAPRTGAPGPRPPRAATPRSPPGPSTAAGTPRASSARRSAAMRRSARRARRPGRRRAPGPGCGATAPAARRGAAKGPRRRRTGRRDRFRQCPNHPPPGGVTQIGRRRSTSPRVVSPSAPCGSRWRATRRATPASGAPRARAAAR